MSSTFRDNVAGRCINGGVTGGYSSTCHSNADAAPWLALDLGDKASVERVVIYNRDDSHAERFKNAKVWVADQLPDSGSQMFSGGQLLGSFEGPAKTSEVVTLTSSSGLGGRFVIVQQDGYGYLNLMEVTVWGKIQGKKKHLLPFQSRAFCPTNN